MTIDPRTVLDRALQRWGSENGQKPCVMNKVHARWLIANGIYKVDRITGLPECTAPIIARAAQRVNDRLDAHGLNLLDDEERQVRLMLAHAPSDPVVAKRVRARVGCWAARSVLHLIRDEDRAGCERAIATREAWLRGEATEGECAAAADAYAYAADAYAAAAYAAYAAYAATAHADAYAATYAADAVGGDLIDWLDRLLDQHEKARAEEGVLHE